MNPTNKTLWMGNVELNMDETYIGNLLSNFGIYPNKIILRIQKGKRGCAFLEFSSHEEAANVLHNFNGKNVGRFQLTFNWVRTMEEKNALPKIKKFTVSNKIFYI